MAGENIRPLLDLIVSRMPAPTFDPAHPFQAQVANLDSSPYLGRLALCRVRHGEIPRGATVAWCRRDGTVTRTRLTELLVAEGLDRVPAERVGPGEIIAIAGLDEVMIGETIADPDDPQPLPLIVIDEPSLSVTVAINTEPARRAQRHEADRAHDQGPARPGAARERRPARVRHRSARTRGRCRAAARCSSPCWPR